MSEETKYVTVPCRVPAGLLKEGETLEWRCARYDDAWLCNDGSRYVCKDKERDYNVPVIVPRFDANAWAAKNLPKPACEREIWAGRAESGWRTWTREPITDGRIKGYYACGSEQWEMACIDSILGPDQFPLDWKQSKFKWQHIRPAAGVDGEWLWVWQGGKQ